MQRLQKQVLLYSLAILMIACGPVADDEGSIGANIEADAGATSVCTPGATETCFTGDSSAVGIGVCVAGIKTCTAAGQWGGCDGEVLPTTEDCTTLDDDDCDGEANEEDAGCVCDPATTQSCYTGAPFTEGVGACLSGLATCVADGSGWGDCVGEVLPAVETCETAEDDDCDGMINEDGTGCFCEPGTTQNCYTGPNGTEGVGTCIGGTTTCQPDGASFSACIDQILPASEQCDGLDHDCNGVPDDPEDVDGDGWNLCQSDCCERSFQCSDPAKVNPGAFEFLNNGVDDDCDAGTSDTVAPSACSTSSDFTDLEATQLAQGMDLCQYVTLDPPIAERKWGVISAELVNANGQAFSASQLADVRTSQTAIMSSYGTGGMVPQLGNTMSGLSTGMMRGQGDPGYVAPNTGTSHGWTSTPNADYLAANGGSLPSSAGCSGACPAGSGANDAVNLRLQIRVPTNAESFSYKFRFLSSEYRQYSCTIFNDFFVALLDTGAAGIPADKNISFDTFGNPVSVNNSFFEVCVAQGCYTCAQGAGELAGTGMDINGTGGATAWLTTAAPIVPGEIMTIEFSIFDVSDNILDSNVLLDAFEWSISPSDVGTHQ